MRKKLFMALALMATMAFGCIVFESSSFAQNTNSSTTSMSGDKHMGRGRHRRHHHRWARRHRRGGSKMKTAGGEKH